MEESSPEKRKVRIVGSPAFANARVRSVPVRDDATGRRQRAELHGVGVTLVGWVNSVEIYHSGPLDG